jgi:hypothetical protein
MAIIDFGSPVWFGDATTEPQAVIEQQLAAAKDEISRLRLALEALKIGDMIGKAILVDLMLQSDDQDVRDLSCRIICSVCTHEDVGVFERFLANANEDDIETFVLYSVQSLSPRVIPYLLALLDDYKGTTIEEEIVFSLGSLFPIESSNIEIDRLQDWFASVNAQIVPNAYYLNGKMAHPGILTKELITKTSEARSRRASLGLMEIPTLLSIWSGVACPVTFSTVVNDDSVKEVLEYVKTLASMQWEHGAKYFYGRRIG